MLTNKTHTSNKAITASVVIEQPIEKSQTANLLLLGGMTSLSALLLSLLSEASEETEVEVPAAPTQRRLMSKEVSKVINGVTWSLMCGKRVTDSDFSLQHWISLASDQEAKAYLDEHTKTLKFHIKTDTGMYQIFDLHMQEDIVHFEPTSMLADYYLRVQNTKSKWSQVFYTITVILDHERFRKEMNLGLEWYESAHWIADWIFQEVYDRAPTAIKTKLGEKYEPFS